MMGGKLKDDEVMNQRVKLRAYSEDIETTPHTYQNQNEEEDGELY